MTNFNLYRYFIVISQEQNITKASEILHISQPALSFSIKQLEEDVGCRLFKRENKGVKLTLEGRLLYDKVYPLIDSLERLDHFANDLKLLKEGILRIGANSANCNQIIETYLQKFAWQYKNIRIQMVRKEQNQLIELLEKGDLDIIFVDKYNFPNHFSLIKEYPVYYQLIGNGQYYNQFKNIKIDDDNFPKDEIILPNENNRSRKFILDFLSDHNIKFTPKYELDSYVLLYDFVKMGLGVAFVNLEYYKNQIKKDDVFILSPFLKVKAREFVILENKNYQNFAKNKFLEIVKEEI